MNLAAVPSGLVAGAIVIWLVRIAYRREVDPFIAKVLVLAVAAKAVGTGARYFVLQDLYGGVGDAASYLIAGLDLSAQIREGRFPVEAAQTGTAFMEFIAGVFYTVAPQTLIAGFYFFSFLSLVGAYLFLQAFRVAVPDGDHRRYAVLIFLVPTMVFWPSSLGKEAWLVLTLGIGGYGAARILQRRRWGYLLTALGIAGMFSVRPHMAALFALSVAGAFVLRFRDPLVRRGATAWILGLVFVGLGAGLVATNFGDELPRDESVVGSQTDQIFAATNERTTTGDSSFDSRPVRNPADLGHALLTVPFRPYPWEGHNIQAALAGLEGLILLVIVLASIPRLLALPTRMLRQPYVALATAYTLGFIVAFSNVGNFGILSRQRAQLIPLLLVLICLPPLGNKIKDRTHAPVLIGTYDPERTPTGSVLPGTGHPTRTPTGRVLRTTSHSDRTNAGRRGAADPGPAVLALPALMDRFQSDQAVSDT